VWHSKCLDCDGGRKSGDLKLPYNIWGTPTVATIAEKRGGGGAKGLKQNSSKDIRKLEACGTGTSKKLRGRLTRTESDQHTWNRRNGRSNKCIKPKKMDSPRVHVGGDLDAILRNSKERRAGVARGGEKEKETASPVSFHNSVGEEGTRKAGDARRVASSWGRRGES